MAKIEALFTSLHTKWSPIKSPNATYGPPANLLMSNLLVRSALNCYGANLEIFLNKRLLPLCYKESTRDNALHCLLRVLRGPRYAEQNAKIEVRLRRVPHALGEETKPLFRDGQRR
tara:strand:- start:130 stop:477 length:348 start_codon:yes stop_codon:yes gene_type:complete